MFEFGSEVRLFISLIRIIKKNKLDWLTLVMSSVKIGME